MIYVRYMPMLCYYTWGLAHPWILLSGERYPDNNPPGIWEMTVYKTHKMHDIVIGIS